MNAKTAKLLKRATLVLGGLLPTYPQLKQAWLRMTPRERSKMRTQLELELGR